MTLPSDSSPEHQSTSFSASSVSSSTMLIGGIRGKLSTLLSQRRQSADKITVFSETTILPSCEDHAPGAGVTFLIPNSATNVGVEPSSSIRRVPTTETDTGTQAVRSRLRFRIQNRAPRLSATALQQVPKFDTQERVQKFVDGLPPNIEFDLSEFAVIHQKLHDIFRYTTSNEGYTDIINDVALLILIKRRAERMCLSYYGVSDLALPLMRIMKRDQLMSRWPDDYVVLVAIYLAAEHQNVVQSLVVLSGKCHIFE